MVSLLDLKRQFRDVPTSAGDIRMYALSVNSITHLLSIFPLVKKLMSGDATTEDLNIQSLMDLGPDVVSNLIACGADMPGDSDAIAAAEAASIGDQAVLIAGVLEASLSKGAAPFLEAVAKIGATINASGLRG